MGEAPEDGSVLIESFTLGAEEAMVGGHGSFSGCVNTLVVNTHQFTLQSLLADSIFNATLVGVTSGCGSGTPCAPNPCPARSVCEASWREHTCACDQGLAVVDGRCDDPCNPDPCQNSAVCRVSTTTQGSSPFSCDCDNAHSGTLCEIEGCGFGLIGIPPLSCQRCICDPRRVQDEICDTETGECSCKVQDL